MIFDSLIYYLNDVFVPLNPLEKSADRSTSINQYIDFPRNCALMRNFTCALIEFSLSRLPLLEMLVFRPKVVAASVAA